MELARRTGLEEVYVHCLLGRRGERPESGSRYVGDIEKEASRLGVGQVVSVIGRYWALDREEHWDRVEKTYRLLVHGEAEGVAAPTKGVTVPGDGPLLSVETANMIKRGPPFSSWRASLHYTLSFASDAAFPHLDHLILFHDHHLSCGRKVPCFEAIEVDTR